MPYTVLCGRYTASSQSDTESYISCTVLRNLLNYLTTYLQDSCINMRSSLGAPLCALLCFLQQDFSLLHLYKRTRQTNFATAPRPCPRLMSYALHILRVATSHIAASPALSFDAPSQPLCTRFLRLSNLSSEFVIRLSVACVHESIFGSVSHISNVQVSVLGVSPRGRRML